MAAFAGDILSSIERVDMTLGVIGGSAIGGLCASRETVRPKTRWGDASGPAEPVTIEGRTAYVIERHGTSGEIAPHRVNYRANLWLLREAGVTEVIALNTVGGIDQRLVPGSIVIPDQIIDYTWGREPSYEDPTVAEWHPEFTLPFDSGLRGAILSAARSANVSVCNGAVYGVTQGPRLETAAEIDRMERDGCDIVGMTAMPEAILARELGLRYAMVCGVVNFAAGRGAGGLIHDEISASLPSIRDAIRRILEHLSSGAAFAGG